MSTAASETLAPNLQLTQSSQSFVALCRWASALLVVLAHLRAVLFVGWESVAAEDRSLLLLLIYGVTALAHEAVIIFFVLSGFLVAGPALARVTANRFDPASYAIDRVTRIYVTLIPALLLTLALDMAGRGMHGSAGFYDQSNMLIAERFGAAFQYGATPQTFLCNLVMLQPVHCPVLGSNVPLWSLSYEVWFYLWFGLVAVALCQRSLVSLATVIGASAALWLFDWTALFYLGIWLLGAASYRTRWQPPRWAGAALLLAGLAASTSDMLALQLGGASAKATDPLVATGFACLLAGFKCRSLRILDRTAEFNRRAADFSYSLYLIHFPVMIFLIPILAAPLGLVPALRAGLGPADPAAMALYGLTLVATIAIGWAFARLFERRTPSVRAAMKRWTGRRRMAA